MEKKRVAECKPISRGNPPDAQVRRGKAKTENKVGKEEDFEKNYSI